MQKRKVTKRGRKATTPPNAMVQYSLNHGTRITLGGSDYVGKNAEYSVMTINHLTQYKKTALGVPFIRIKS